MEAVARKLLDLAKRMAPERFEPRPANGHTHPHVDWDAYERMRQVMAGLGFRLLGDYDPANAPGGSSAARPTVLRIFLSHDGIVTATFYRMPLRWTLGGIRARLKGHGRGMLDLSTSFTNDTTLETSTAPLVGKWQNPPFLLREYQPQMHPGALLARHTERIAEQMEWNPGIQPYRVSTLEQLVALGQNTARRKREFRRSIGWITRDELASHAPGANPARLDRIHAEIRRLVALETAAAPVPPPTPSAPPAPATRPGTPPPPTQPSTPSSAASSSDTAPAAPPDSVAPVESPGTQPAPTAPVDREPAVEAVPAIPSALPLRALDEVVGRAVVMNALVNLHFRAPVEVVRRWIEANGGAPHLSPRERMLLSKTNAQVTPEERAGLRGYIEALWALLWAGGVAAGLAPGQPVPGHMATLVPNLKTNEDAAKLRERMHLRSIDEIAAMHTRYERVHASLSDGATLPTLDAGVIRERRKVLEWLTDPALGWDEASE